MIYFGYTFYKRSKNRSNEDNETFFNRRHPSTIYVTIIFCIFFVVIERPLSFLIYQMEIIKLPYDYGAPDAPFQFFSYALGCYGIYFTFLQRFWMVFYSYKYYVAQAKLVWKKQLNPEYDENDNFFFANIDSLGSFQQTSPCLVILWMITVITFPIVTTIKNGIPFDLATFVLLLPPFLILLYIAKKIHKITDQYFIRDELILCCIIMGITITLHLFIYLFIGLPLKNNSEIIKLQVLLGSFISCIQYVCLVYIITIWVLKKNDKYHIERPSSTKHGGNREHSHDSNTNTQITTLRFFSTNSNTATPTTTTTTTDLIQEEKGIRKKKLYNLLKTKHGFNLFMMHLTVELSVENLLFICEYVQYKRSISRKHLNGKIVGWIEELPNQFIPKAEAIHLYPDDYLSQIHLIFDKYIKWGAALELNISARRRKRILLAFDAEKQNGKIDENLMKKGWKELSMFYDPVAIEIWKLMNDSFGRIIETQQYQTWHDQLPKKVEEENKEQTQLNIPT